MIAFSTRELVSRAIARGEITLRPPEPPSPRPVAKGVWSDESKARQRANQSRAWTPERRQRQSEIMRRRMGQIVEKQNNPNAA